MVVDTIGQAATFDKGLQSAMNAEDFLQLFAAQLQYQDPTAPMDNSQMMQQLSQITQLQAVNELTTGMKNLLHNNEMLQASGLIGRTVSYVSQDDALVQDTVNSVSVESDGSVSLGLGGGAQINLSAIHKVM